MSWFDMEGWSCFVTNSAHLAPFKRGLLTKEVE